jgi:hypothetical protein
MRRTRRRPALSMLATVVLGTVGFAACSGGDDSYFFSNDLKGGPCDPGTVRECLGPMMCVGEQKCAPNGKGYNACSCKGGPNEVVDAAADSPISNADAAGDGPTSNADAAFDGPTSNADAAFDGPTSNADAAFDGPTSNADAAGDGPISNGDASDDAPMPNLGVLTPPGAADDAPR